MVKLKLISIGAVLLTGITLLANTSPVRVTAADRERQLVNLEPMLPVTLTATVEPGSAIPKTSEVLSKCTQERVDMKVVEGGTKVSTVRLRCGDQYMFRIQAISFSEVQ